MIPIKTTIIPVHPSTHVRSTKNEGWLLAESVSYEYLEGLDAKRLLTKGKVGTLAARKRQLEIHRAHKLEISAWVERTGFTMPLGHFAVWFYVPMPASWRPKKRTERLHTVHQNTPDLDNYLKQLYDSVMPRKNRLRKEKGCDDRKIFSYAAFKVWVEWDEACIKVVEYPAAEFMQTFKAGHPRSPVNPINSIVR